MTLPHWFSLPLDETLVFYRAEWENAFKFGGERACNASQAIIAENDLFFLLTEVLNRADLIHPWVFERCREFQRDPDGYLDLWAREHYKSTIITFGGSFREIIKNPEITIGLFSHTRPLAKQFLRQIMFEMEANKKLPLLWPGIFWNRPRAEAPKWSEDDGIIVKRTSNPKESTVEAWGLVDGQPTSKHFMLRVYDDIVVEGSVSTPEQIAKTTKGWELSDNLGAKGGASRHAGTRYHLFDTYSIIEKRGVTARVHAATMDGTETGIPVLMSDKDLKAKRVKQGPYTFASQMLLNPVADKAMGFKQEWLQYAIIDRSAAMRQLNRYIIVDPASEKRRKARKDPDFSTFWVVGLSGAKNYYVLDCIRDRLNLTGRAQALIGLHRKWQPKGVGYEQYGMQADIEHIKTVQRDELYEFEITELGGLTAKNDRIKLLVPPFEQKRFFLPEAIMRTDSTGQMQNLVKVFIEEEYSAFPVLAHDDMFDGLARILDTELAVVWPDPEQPVEAQGLDYGSIENAIAQKDWTTA